MNKPVRSIAVSLVVLAAVSVLTHQLAGTSVTKVSTAPARHYYLTKGAVNGDAATTACASGYHFASFAEINDLSNLTYDTTLGRVEADSGQGPPTFGSGHGWIRSGYAANASTTGSSLVPTNCNGWTSA